MPEWTFNLSIYAIAGAILYLINLNVWGVTVSRAAGSNISTYGVGFTWEVGVSSKKRISIGKKLFGTNSGWSFYWSIPVGKNAKALYNTVKGKV